MSVRSGTDGVSCAGGTGRWGSTLPGVIGSTLEGEGTSPRTAVAGWSRLARKEDADQKPGISKFATSIQQRASLPGARTLLVAPGLTTLGTRSY